MRKEGNYSRRAVGERVVGVERAGEGRSRFALNCLNAFFRLLLPGGTPRSLGLRRGGQVDKGRRVVSARHGVDEGPRGHPLGGVETVGQRGTSRICQGREPNVRPRASVKEWPEIRQRETRCRASPAPTPCGGRGRVGSALRRWLGPPTRRHCRPSFPRPAPPRRFFDNWGHIPQTPCQKGTPPLDSPSYGERGPPAFAGAGSALRRNVESSGECEAWSGACGWAWG